MTNRFPELSSHAAERAAQRNLSYVAIRYVIRHGLRIHRAGAVFYFLRDCDIRDEDRSDSEFTRLEGTAVVLSQNQKTILTVWRNRKTGLLHIRRKAKFTNPPWKRPYS